MWFSALLVVLSAIFIPIGHISRNDKYSQISTEFTVPQNVTSSPLVSKPLIIAHRGASGMFPEHSAEAYKAAIDQGADYIECDVVLTKDAIPICLHDPYLHRNTDIAERPDLAQLKSTFKFVHKKEELTSWFTWNLTWAQIQSLKTVQTKDGRDTNYNGQFSICSLEDYLEIAENATRQVGTYTELKYPAIFNKILNETGRVETMEEIVVSVLNKFGYTSKSSPGFIQCFSIDSLLTLSTMTPLPLVYLIHDSSDIEQIPRYAEFIQAVGIWKKQVVVVDEQTKRISTMTSLVKDFHSLGLLVHVYTFRNEGRYLAADYGHDPYQELEMFRQIGIDGYFTDFPRTAYNFFNLIN